MAQPTLLLIAEHPQFAYLIRRYGEQAGCLVVGAESADEARAWLAEHAPAMVFLHLGSWPHQGWSLLGQIRQHCADEAIPITVIGSLADEARARAEGARFWLWQPVMYPDFLAVLRAGQVATAALDAPVPPRRPS